MKVEVDVLGSPYLTVHTVSVVSVDVKQHGTTSTETIMTIRDGEPRTFTSTFTQLLSSSSMLLNIHRDHV